MKSLRWTLVIAALFGGSAFAAASMFAAREAEPGEITEEPALELAHDNLAIVRWTIKNPGGSDVHYGIVRYGTDPDNLDRMAQSPVRINRGHRETVMRVRVAGLTPRTRYYYKVGSIESASHAGKHLAIEEPTHDFTTPAPGARSAAFP